VTSSAADVVVIGAGHNGLVAACYLAGAGLDVLVVDAAPYAGGMTRTERSIVGAPDHVLHPCAVESVLFQASSVARDLALDEAGLRFVYVDPAYVHLDPDGPSVGIWRDPRRTADDIARLSRRDAAAYLEIVDALAPLADVALGFLAANPMCPPPRLLAGAVTTLARRAGTTTQVARLFSRPPVETLEARFEHPVVRNALGMLLAAGGPLTARATATSFLFLAFVHRLGVCRPAGGMGVLADALVTRLTETGGSVRLSSPVVEILVDSRRATGVRLASGETITARRAVVSTVDPHRLAEELLPAGALPGRLVRRLTRLPANASGMGTLKVDVALAEQVRPTLHEKWRADGIDLRHSTVMLGSLESLGRAHTLACSGRWAGDLPLWSLVVSGLDPTLAPPGQDVVYLWSGWAPLAPAEGEDAYRAAASDAILASADGVLDGLAAAEIGRRVATSADLAQDYRVTNGCLTHIDISPLTTGPLRPTWGLGGYRTPVAGLYLSGAGTHPGGGVSGLPGQIAARAVLSDQRSREDANRTGGQPSHGVGPFSQRSSPFGLLPGREPGRGRRHPGEPGQGP
jgi:phytoene dehydrogenase-like protein